MNADDLATARQAAHIIGVSERRIRQLAQEGTLTVAESSPLRIPVRDCLAMREARDAKDRPGGTNPGESLLDIVNKVASAMLPAALEAGRADRAELQAARDALRDRVEADLRSSLAEALAAQVTAEQRLAALEDELASVRSQVPAPKSRRWRKS